ncbi:hypothetical protein PTMSG1_10208 [Pyrenophora teres f. maculata]|nr:hypothetical protein PTMSG1_10208 [Pyrenophora teres f. maculata]
MAPIKHKGRPKKSKRIPKYGDLRTYFPTIPKQVSPAPANSTPNAASRGIGTLGHVQRYQKVRAFTPVKIKEEELSSADEDETYGTDTEASLDFGTLIRALYHEIARVMAPVQIKEEELSSAEEEDDEQNAGTGSATETEGEDMVVTQPVRAPMHAFYRAHASATKYFDEFSYALGKLNQAMQTPNSNGGPVIDVPRSIVRGEYTLYSPEWMSLHQYNHPHLWTAQSAPTWSAGTLRLGYRWGQSGGMVGLEFTITGIDHVFTTVVDIEGKEAGHAHAFGTHTLVVFVGGPYIGLQIAKGYLGVELEAGEDPLIQFHGILDRTEEEMYKWGSGMPERKRYPYYKAPYTATLPQARARC